MSKRVALVLSGGGAFGAFQFGAIKYIEEEFKKIYPDFKYSIISGVSVGSINAVFLAMNEYEYLKSVWEKINYKDIFSSKMGFKSLLKVLFGAKYLTKNTPLYKRLKQTVHLKKIDKDVELRIGVVSMRDGEYKVLQPEDFSNDLNFRKAILASTSIPVLTKPVKSIKLKNGEEILHVVDGGVRQISPIKDVLSLNPDILVIINCTPRMEEKQKLLTDVFSIAKIVVTQINMNENINSSLTEFIRINDLVKQAREQGIKLIKPDGTEYKVFDYIIIEPDEYIGDMLDFSSDIIKLRIKKGYDIAKQQFESFTYF